MKRLTRKPTMAEIDKYMCGLAAQKGIDPVHQRHVPKEKRAYVKSEIPTESQEQRAFVEWFGLQFPTVKFFAIPNGGNRDAITGAIMKAEGVKRGVPDIYIPEWRLWIEFKRIKGSVISDEQREWELHLVGVCGDSHFFAYGCQDAIAHVKLFVKYREGK